LHDIDRPIDVTVKEWDVAQSLISEFQRHKAKLKLAKIDIMGDCAQNSPLWCKIWATFRKTTKGVFGVNAAEQAIGVTLATKIAAVVTLFKAQFPDMRADLKPWANDADTREWLDPESIDIGFHLPGWSRRFQCRSILVQIRFHEEEERKRAIGVEAFGFTNMGEQWHFSTVENWRVGGKSMPSEEIQEKLRLVCRQVFELFNGQVESL
jgi:hypothetical protein